MFAPCEVLNPAVRRRLSSLVGCAPGQPPPLFPGELAGAPLPLGAGGRAELRSAVEAGLGDAALVELGGMRLGEVVPVIRTLAGDVAARPTPVRLQSLLERNGASTWAVLAERTLGEIASWAGMGHKGLARLVGLALDAGIDGSTGAVWAQPGSSARTSTPGPAVSPTAADDLSLLLARGAGGAVRSALEGCTGEDQAEEVRSAATRLLARFERVRHPILAVLDQALAAVGDTRDLGVLYHCVLRLEGRSSLAQVATALGVGTERVRQIRARAAERLDAALGAPGAPGGAGLDHLARDLAERLGAAAPIAAVDEVLTSSGLPALPDTRSLLALWLAGPYHPVKGHQGWVATDPGELLAETRRLLGEDGGVTSREQVAKELATLDVTGQHAGLWLERQAVQAVDGLLVLTAGTVAEVAERALFAAGRAMTGEELVAAVWPGPGEPGRAEVEAALRRDRRFVAVGAGRFELAEWGGAPASEAVAERPGPEGARCWLLVEVNAPVLTGALAPVPLPLVEALGMHEGLRRTFASRFGPVALAYDGVPTRGSVRHVALAAGAVAGDVVAFGFDGREGDAVVVLVHRHEVCTGLGEIA
ncbi:MAG: hypothetical protein WD232_01705 [Acidimicrobiales bacterium]